MNTPTPSRENTLFGSLAWRLTAWYALSSFVMILAIAVISYYALLSSFSRETDGYLRDTAEQLDLIHTKSLKYQVEEELPTRSYMFTFARVLDYDGHVVEQSGDMQTFLPSDHFPPPIEIKDPAAKKPGELHGEDYLSTARNRTYRVLALKFGAPHKWIVQIACDRQGETVILRRYKFSLGVVLGLAFLLCAAGGYLIARYGIRPVAKIAGTAGQIGHGTLHERIATSGLPDELRQLAFAFNAMLDRLQESFARISQFSEDIAHELRTPVNNLRGGMEVVLGKPRTPEDYLEAIGSALEECERLARLVDRLLFIARSENSAAKIERDAVNVREQLAKTQEFFEVNAEESGVTIGVNAPDALEINANRDLLRSLIGNLVSNALAHTPSGGRIDMLAVQGAQGVVITVKDTGKGIPPEHLPHIFDRFYRVDRSRSKTSGGVGLGLAIVATIAKLHGATLDVQSELGKGTSISVTFPRE